MRDLMQIVENILGQYDAGHGSLYHGTDVPAAAMILASNTITPSIDSDNPRFQGVSLTYDVPMAWEFAGRATHILMEHASSEWRPEFGDVDPNQMPDKGAVLELDVARLRHDYRLVRYTDDVVYDDEFEVRALGKGIVNLSAYIEKVHLVPTDIEWFIRYAETKAGQYRFDGSNIVKFLRSMQAHPKVGL